MLATAAALSRRPAHQVAWASGREVGAAAGRAGVEFFDLLNTGWSDLPHLPAGLPRSSLLCCASSERWTRGCILPAILPAVADLQVDRRRLASGCYRSGTLCCRGGTGRGGQPTANRRLRPTCAARTRPAHRADMGQPTRTLVVCTVRGGRALLGPLASPDPLTIPARRLFLAPLVCRFASHRSSDHLRRQPATAGAGSAGSADDPHYLGQPVPRRPPFFAQLPKL